MITVGFIQELEFISKAFKTPVYLKLATEKTSGLMDIILKDDFIEISYKQNKIWKEKLSTADSMFGIESCDTVFKIVSLIEDGNEKWKELCFFEK